MTMSRAPLLAAAVLVVSVAMLITLVGPLLLFNPWFVSAQQGRHEVPARLGTTQDEVDRVTGSMLRDVFVDGDFTVALDGEAPMLDDFERSHMSDVSRLVRTLLLALGVAAAGALASAIWLRRERARVGRLLLGAAASVGLAAVVLAVIFAVAFEPAFLAFHRLFFDEGTFMFGPRSDLIKVFPQGFWYDAALAAGASIVVSAAAVVLVGLRLVRRTPA